jgi:hypothetical protein
VLVVTLAWGSFDAMDWVGMRKAFILFQCLKKSVNAALRVHPECSARPINARTLEVSLGDDLLNTDASLLRFSLGIAIFL